MQLFYQLHGFHLLYLNLALVIISITDSLKRGGRVDIRGFGSFIVKHRTARDARNPATSEVVKLKDRFIPSFKVSKILKEDVNHSRLKEF